MLNFYKMLQSKYHFVYLSVYRNGSFDSSFENSYGFGLTGSKINTSPRSRVGDSCPICRKKYGLNTRFSCTCGARKTHGTWRSERGKMTEIAISKHSLCSQAENLQCTCSCWRLCSSRSSCTMIVVPHWHWRIA